MGKGKVAPAPVMVVCAAACRLNAMAAPPIKTFVNRFFMKCLFLESMNRRGITPNCDVDRKATDPV
jgi:hypothetical protein